MTANKNWPLIHLNVKFAFLSGPLQQKMYVLQPSIFMIENKEQMVYNLHKALYRLKQPPRVWNPEINFFFNHQGFKKCAKYL